MASHFTVCDTDVEAHITNPWRWGNYYILYIIIKETIWDFFIVTCLFLIQLLSIFLHLKATASNIACYSFIDVEIEKTINYYRKLLTLLSVPLISHHGALSTASFLRASSFTVITSLLPQPFITALYRRSGIKTLMETKWLTWQWAQH